MENNIKKKFNVLDWIIIAVLVFALASIALRFFNRQEIAGASSSGKYAISFSVKDVRYSTADAFIKGDGVYVATDDTYIGTFERLDSNNPAAYYADDPDSGTVKVYYPEGTRVDLTGTIISEGVMNADGYFVGGSYFIGPGKLMTVYTSHVYVELTVNSITKYVE